MHNRAPFRGVSFAERKSQVRLIELWLGDISAGRKPSDIAASTKLEVGVIDNVVRQYKKHSAIINRMFTRNAQSEHLTYLKEFTEPQLEHIHFYTIVRAMTGVPMEKAFAKSVVEEEERLIDVTEHNLKLFGI